MSAKNDEILEHLKSLTLLEAAELVQQIEETFGVIASNRNVSYLDHSILIGSLPIYDDRYDVVLEAVPTDKRISILKALRAVTGLGLKEAKNFVESVPQVVQTVFSKNQAEDIKQQLEAAGAKVSIT